MLIGGVFLAVVIYGALVATLFANQRRFLYPGWGEASGAGLPIPPGFEAVTLKTTDGETLASWWKPPEPGRALVLYFFGNGGSLGNLRGRAALLAQSGRGVLMISYRGYPGSTGSPSEEGLALDAEAALRWLSSWEPKRTVIYGESLGSGVAVRLASGHPVGGVILDAPFTSIPDVARRAFWFVPLDLLLKDQFRSIDRIGTLRMPLLVMHGARDAVVPIALGRRLFVAANEPKRFVEIADATHSEVLERGGLAEVDAFLREVEGRLGVPKP